MSLGGSSRRPKIDPKRPQEKTNNDLDKDRTRRDEKKDNKNEKKSQQEFSKCFESVWPVNKGSARKRKPEQFGRRGP